VKCYTALDPHRKRPAIQIFTDDPARIEQFLKDCDARGYTTTCCVSELKDDSERSLN
jgi:hypothetical protein